MSISSISHGRTLAAAALFMAATAGTSFAQCPADDAITTNADCANASPLALGASGPFSVQGIVSALGVNEDWWTFVVPAGEEITIDVLFTHVPGAGDVDLDLYDDVGACGNEVDSAGSVSDNEQVTYANVSAAPVTVTLRVFNFNATLADCADYSINATSVVIPPDPCLTAMDDAEEENDTCLASVLPSANPLLDLVVSLTDEDYYTYNLAAGEILDIRLDYINNDGDVDAQLLDGSDCSTVLVDSNFSFSNFEDLTYTNNTGAAQTVVLRVLIDITTNISINCNTYDLSSTVTVDPCFLSIDDAEEDNDTCATAVVPSANPLIAMFASKSDPDYYLVSVPPGDILTVDATFIDSNGNLDVRIFDATCAIELDAATSFSDNETASASNSSATAVDMVIEVTHLATDTAASCNVYDLTWATAPDPCLATADDMFEENDDCTMASPVSAGLQTGLFVRKEGVDEDWYSTDVFDGATITVTCTFINDDGDIDIDLFDACGGALLQASTGVADTEDVFWTNNTGATVNVKWGVFVWSGDPTEDCNTYDMDVDIQGGMPTNLIPYCFGDGSGTACPCGNNSTAGHPGGCANSAGNGAVLVATGNPTVGADTLNMDLSSASLNSFALLVSGVNQLPQMGGCIGCGLLAFDGLRCAGGSFLRHGSRATNGSGETGNGWGPPGGPAGGLIAANGFMMGQTRNFFAFYRDNPAFVCQTGQNSSNGIQIMFN